MRPRAAIVLLWSGVALVVATLALAAVAGVGVPFQDPTPQQRAREIRQMRAVEWSLALGIILAAAGGTGVMVRLVRARAGRRIT